jgi:hypothetical protein
MAQVRRQYGPPYPYDAVISGIGVMLDKMPDGSPAWIEKSIEFFSGDVQLSAEDRGYVQFPPTVELPYAWTDLIEGYGAAELTQSNKFRRRYHYALYADCSTGRPMKGPLMNDQGSLTITSGTTPSQVVEFGGTLYLICGDKIFMRNDDTQITGGGSGGGWTAVTVPATFSGKTIGKCAVFRGTQSAALLFVPIGSSANYYTMTTGRTFTQHASQKASHFEVVGDALWLANTESNQEVIRTCSDGGTTATWLGPTYIGDGTKGITWMQAVQDRLLVLKEDGIFAPTDGAAIDEDLTPDLRPLANTNNGKRSIAWASKLIASYGEMLWKYSPDSGELEQFGPETLEANASEVKGPVRSISGHGNQALYAGVYNAANTCSYLVKYGTYRTEDGANGPQRQFMPVWHGALYKWGAGNRIDLVHATTVTSSPRLYTFVNTSATTLEVYHCVLPRTTNPADDPNYRFDTSNTGEVYYPRWTGNFPFENKLLKGIGVGGRNLGTGISVGAQYKQAADTNYISLGTSLAEGGERLAPTGSPSTTAFDFVATLATTSSSTSPILGSFVVYSALRTNTGLKDITATIRIRDRVLDRRGQPLRETWETLRDDLENAITTVGSISIITPKGETATVIGISFSEAMLGEDSNGAITWTMTVRMVQTAVTYTRGTWSRAAAYTWGDLSGLTWGDVAVI